MAAFRVERNHGPFPGPGSVLLWRDKRGHEVDFVLAARRKKPVALECKWSANHFDLKSLIAFRHQHPEGDNLVIANDVDRALSGT
jgi:hypothetical protein